jgi:hypothetical protein
MKTILFVCVQNSCRGKMAEAFFDKQVEGKAQALSAGALLALKGIANYFGYSMKVVGMISIGAGIYPLITMLEL